MVLVDTSIWVHHLRRGNAHLQSLLQEDRVLIHPFIAGELACGHLKNRAEILYLLSALPHATLVEFEEVLHFIETRKLMGKGIGFIDVHLLASAQLSKILLWTEDKGLLKMAADLKLLYQPASD